MPKSQFIVVLLTPAYPPIFESIYSCVIVHFISVLKESAYFRVIESMYSRAIDSSLSSCHRVRLFSCYTSEFILMP